MFDVQQTPDFFRWLRKLKDQRATWLIASQSES